MRPNRRLKPVSGASFSSAIASRHAALEILAAVLDRARPLDEAVDAAFSHSNLAPRDRAFARLLATTVVRRLGQIDDALAGLVSVVLPLRPLALMNLLRLGAAQLLFIGTPPHAAVATAVDLADAVGLGRGKGMANAVLRRLAAEGAAILKSQDEARLNLPAWLWSRWTARYGESITRAIVAQHLQEPPLDLTVMPSEDTAFWAKVLDAALLPTGTLRRSIGGRIEELPGFDDGKWWVQDMAAALPAGLFEGLAGKQLLDLCAAPGGKTAQLASAGAMVTSVDRSAARLAILARNLDRLHLKAECVAADALAWKPRDGADAILLDAPCTATGTGRRHPDMLLSKTEADLRQLVGLQSALLDRAADWLSPGGTLVYCTCSLEPEEGEAQIARLLAKRPELTRRAIRPNEVGGLAELIDQRGDLRTLPCHMGAEGGMDGFYAARLVRTD